jgi:hypothetical protein
MAGLGPAIHVFDSTRDSRRGCHRNSGLYELRTFGGAGRVNPTCADKRGHDESRIAAAGMTLLGAVALPSLHRGMTLKAQITSPPGSYPFGNRVSCLLACARTSYEL